MGLCFFRGGPEAVAIAGGIGIIIKVLLEHGDNMSCTNAAISALRWTMAKGSHWEKSVAMQDPSLPTLLTRAMDMSTRATQARRALDPNDGATNAEV